ncbi:hypothetical protein HDU92_000526 [Lobulomyces angularis]|nr:hypothetical protein HDU92_000526 [Lobulomyces angularis]
MIKISGNSRFIGIRLKDGLDAAFSRFNTEEATTLGFSIKLITLDDGYEIETAKNNLIDFIENEEVFALIGTMGTPIVASELNFTRRYVSDKINREFIPVIGHFSGGMSLRAREGEPFPYQIINIRGSYFDESRAMIYFLLEHLSGIKRISVFYQKDAYGQTGLDGITKSLQEKSLSVHSTGHYERNTANVTEGINQIFKGKPQAICMFGTYQAIAPFVVAVKKINPNVVFMAVTFTSPAAVLNEMIKLGGIESSRNFYVTQGLPLYTSKSSSLVKELIRDHFAYQKVNSTVTSVHALFLEGYVTARFAIEIFKKMKLNGIPPEEFTNESFLKTVYSTSIFDIGDLRIGPFGDTSCDLIGAGCRCNQGARKIWISAVNETNQEYYEVPSTNFQFATCGVRFQLPKEIFFAISTNLETSRGMAFVNGLKIAFNAMNEKGVMNGITVSLLINNDGDNATVANDFAKTLKDKKVIALLLPMWNSSFSEARKTLNENSIPIVNDLRVYTSSPSVIQLIPSFFDNVQLLFTFAFNQLRVNTFSAIISTEFHEKEKELKDYLTSSYDQSLSSVILINYDEEIPFFSEPGAIFIIGDESFTYITINKLEAKFVKSYYLIPTFVSSHDLKEKIPAQAEEKTFCTSSVLDYSESDNLIVRSFYKDAESIINYDLSESEYISYLTGLFVVEVLRRSKNFTDPIEFINSIYTTRVFQFQEETFSGFYHHTIFDDTHAFSQNTYDEVDEDGGFCNYGYFENFVTEVKNINKKYHVEVGNNQNLCLNSKKIYHHRNKISEVFMQIFSIIGITITILSIIYIILVRHENLVKASEINILITSLVGIAMMYCIVLIHVSFHKFDSCMLIQYLDNISFCFIFGGMVAKSYRVAVVLRKSKNIDVRNTFVKQKYFLYFVVFGSTAAICIYLVVWHLMNPKKLLLEDYNGTNIFECVQKYSNIWILVPIFFQLVFIVIGLFLTIQTRASWNQFSEYKLNGIAMYNFSFSMIIIYLVEFAVNDLDLALLVTSIIILYNATVKIFLTLGNKLSFKKEDLKVLRNSVSKNSSFFSEKKFKIPVTDSEQVVEGTSSTSSSPRITENSSSKITNNSSLKIANDSNSKVNKSSGSKINNNSNSKVNNLEVKKNEDSKSASIQSPVVEKLPRVNGEINPKRNSVIMS